MIFVLFDFHLLFHQERKYFISSNLFTASFKISIFGAPLFGVSKNRGKMSLHLQSFFCILISSYDKEIITNKPNSFAFLCHQIELMLDEHRCIKLFLLFYNFHLLEYFFFIFSVTKYQQNFAIESNLLTLYL